MGSNTSSINDCFLHLMILTCYLLFKPIVILLFCISLDVLDMCWIGVHKLCVFNLSNLICSSPLNWQCIKEAMLYFSRMSTNENRATKAKHIHYQMSSVDHCHREDVPCRHSGGTVRILFLFCFACFLRRSLGAVSAGTTQRSVLGTVTF